MTKTPTEILIETILRLDPDPVLSARLDELASAISTEAPDLPTVRT